MKYKFCHRCLLVATGFFFVVSTGVAQVRSISKARIHETLTVLSNTREPDVLGASSIPELPRHAKTAYNIAQDPSDLARIWNNKEQLPNKIKKSLISCGPSMAINTLSCLNLQTGAQEFEMPIPGTLSAIPIYFDNSWLIGTSKGFLFRTTPTLVGQKLPYFSNNSLFALWGQESRKFIKLLSDNSGDASDKNALPNKNNIDWLWYFKTGAEFIGTPIVTEKQVFAVTSNQFLYSLDWNTGHLLWTLRIAPEATLRLGSASMTFLPEKNELIVGTTEGDLIDINAKTGAINWQYRIPLQTSERFRSILAKPLLINNSLIVASSDGVTQRLALDKCSKKADSSVYCSDISKYVEWSLPFGQSVSPINFEDKLIVGTTTGQLLLLNSTTGAVLWKNNLFPESSVAGLSYLGNISDGLIVAASATGVMALISAQDGKVLDATPSLGEPVGNFFLSGKTASEVCLSFTQNSLRCFDFY